MARVVVVGGGLAGIATAARLAKLGHAVTLVEADQALGGALRPVTQDGFGWDGGPETTLLPAVLRDLFRKTGRPLENELDLHPLDVLRQHRFEDGSRLDLASGSRPRQAEAFEHLKSGLGAQWTSYVDAFTDDWEVLRAHYFENPWNPGALPREVARRFDSRATLHRHLRSSLRDPRARLVAAHPFVADGHDVRNVPAWAGLTAYLEQLFGGWRFDGGTEALLTALTARLATRKVEVSTSTRAIDVILRSGRAAGLSIERDGVREDLDADIVVCAVDPRRLPALASAVERTMPALPPTICHLGLSDDADDPLPDFPAEVVLHGDPLIVLRTGGRAPEGHRAWTLHGRGKLAEDIVIALRRRGIDLRSRVVTRVDLNPRQAVETWNGSPYGVLWQGRGTVRNRLGPTTPISGLYAVGAHATPGAGIPFVGLSAALVAQCVGEA